MPEKSEQRPRKDTEQRLKDMLRGAFAGPASPVKGLSKRVRPKAKGRKIQATGPVKIDRR